MHPDEEQQENTPSSDASPTQPVHPLSGHQIWIEGNREAPAVPYHITIHDLTTGKAIPNCIRVDMILDVERNPIQAHLTLHRGKLRSDGLLKAEVVTVKDPMVSLKAYVGEVGIDDSEEA